LALPSSQGVPEMFDLRIPQRNETIPCRVRWRRQDGVGVEFNLPPSPKQVATLEAEIARLREIIEQLKAELAQQRAGKPGSGS
jgi:hypothetical protein